jgi:hypothetical protein
MLVRPFETTTTQGLEPTDILQGAGNKIKPLIVR